jgi:hypothetical protein
VIAHPNPIHFYGSLENRNFVGKKEGKKNEGRGHSKIPPKFR